MATTTPTRPKLTNEVAKLVESARKRELVFVFGTGVSLNLTNGSIPHLSWKGLIESGLARAHQLGRIEDKQRKIWEKHLKSNDMDELLSVAEFVGRKLEAPKGDLYPHWLRDCFQSIDPANESLKRAILRIHSAGLPICTLNYDHLAEAVTGLPPLTLEDTRKVVDWMRQEHRGVFHLHGAWDKPETCVLGIRDYQTTLQNEVRELIQRSLGSFKRLLFVGCGDTFADPNFDALTRWLRSSWKGSAPSHFALVRDSEVAGRRRDATWQGFVEPLGYGPNHSDLAEMLLAVAGSITPAKLIGSRPSSGAPGSPAGILREYRSYLLEDCGQMTIEGVRADGRTAERRFDLERLFVPLEVSACAPDFAQDDPARDEKIATWLKKHGKPRDFGSAFNQHKRIALLALPGGGKTLLLKRLTVAYASRDRLTASSDKLPSLVATPVLIRCREWRDHIHLPISTILRSLPEITGRASLAGIDEALGPLLKSGEVLLLVDGLDEIHDGGARTTFVENLGKFVNQFPLIRLVVTSREAGFHLVAPTLAQYCHRLRIAPLNSSAIRMLCDQWHRELGGETKESREDSHAMAEQLLETESLRRLAENPLLLTMLLVVKTGAGGRFPADRVSLYQRAVEVLLDTWNIKGHPPLSTKEAVPQLAYVAFELMRDGKQTATEQELLHLLEEARQKVPRIALYARDTPEEFLRRVELRSSLLVEVGRQLYRGSVVPFYQFRHLTFQEYLAAVATADGHYADYRSTDTLLTPLEPHLLRDDWKEVVPMSCVLANKRAETVVQKLIDLCRPGRNAVVAEMEKPALRLAQCLAEEVESPPSVVTAALSAILSVIGVGWKPFFPLRTIAAGPYGEQLVEGAWSLYKTLKWHPQLRRVCSHIAHARRPRRHWQGQPGRAEILSMLRSNDAKHIWLGAFTCAGEMEDRSQQFVSDPGKDELLVEIEKQLFRTDEAVTDALAWTWGYIHLVSSRLAPSISKKFGTVPILDRLLALWMTSTVASPGGRAALTTQLGLPRGEWRPTLTPEMVSRLKSTLQKEPNEHASLMVSFHARGEVLSDAELLARLRASKVDKDRFSAMAEELEDRGHRVGRRQKSKRA